jgi:hypothetical protein
LFACSDSGKANPVPPADAGGDAAFTYAATGCAYTVAPPESHDLADVALDDGQAPTDPTQAAPQRVRLGLGGNTTFGAAGYADPTTTAAFVWETAADFHGSKVRLGPSPTSFTTTQTGFSYVSAGAGPSNFHEVDVCGLTPATTYYYQVGGGAPGSEIWSATQSFTTLPAAGPVTIGVSGDSRDSSTIFQLVNERMRDAAVSMQLFSGDLILLGNEETQFSQWLDAIWTDPNDATKFLTLGQQLILFVGGNHEAMTTQYYANVALPGSGPAAESYGSFVVGSAHVLLLDDEAIAGEENSTFAPTQLAWIDQDLTLAEADRKNHPFLVVVHHRGDFSTSLHENDPDVVATRTALVPLWDKHHVDLVLNGHDHEYERSKPVTGPVSAPVVQTSSTAGTTYTICAGAGATSYTPGTTPVAYRQTNAAFGSGTPYVGVYSLVTFDGGTLTYKAYGLKTAGGSVAGDDVIDSFTLSR